MQLFVLLEKIWLSDLNDFTFFINDLIYYLFIFVCTKWTKFLIILFLNYPIHIRLYA